MARGRPKKNYSDPINQKKPNSYNINNNIVEIQTWDHHHLKVLLT
jgi:hypothetical protein